MRTSSLALRTTNTTVLSPFVEYRTPSDVRAKIFEIGIVQADAAAQVAALSTVSTRGVTPVEVLFQADDPADGASTVTGSLSWATPPVGADLLRYWQSAAVAGVGVLWTFPHGLWLDFNDSITILNANNGCVSDVNATIEDGLV